MKIYTAMNGVGKIILKEKDAFPNNPTEGEIQYVNDNIYIFKGSANGANWKQLTFEDALDIMRSGYGLWKSSAEFHFQNEVVDSGIIDWDSDFGFVQYCISSTQKTKDTLLGMILNEDNVIGNYSSISHNVSKKNSNKVEIVENENCLRLNFRKELGSHMHGITKLYFEPDNIKLSKTSIVYYSNHIAGQTTLSSSWNNIVEPVEKIRFISSIPLTGFIKLYTSMEI